MKHWMIAALLQVWPRTRLKRARRVDENRLELLFGQRPFLVDLSPSGALIVPDLHEGYSVRPFSAPFDVQLQRQLDGATLQTIRLDAADKVLSLGFEKSGGYKSHKSTLILELTGRHSNAILIDSDGVVIEALHHLKNRIRHIAPGYPYQPPPPPPRAPQSQDHPDIIAYLQEQFHAREARWFTARKAEQLKAAQKRIDHFRRLLSQLSDADTLLSEAEQARHEGSLILANLSQIAPYASEVHLEDFEGAPITLKLDPSSTPQQVANKRFHQARRLEAKARGIFREKESLHDRLAFYQRLYRALQAATSEADLARLTLKKQRRKKGDPGSHEPIERFEIEGFRVLLGRNERGNALLLKRAKATDLWLHLQARPSCHVIVVTDKQKIPPQVIEQAARLCVQFSVTQRGAYLVDYTPRRYVRIVKEAQVNYTHQKTLAITL